MCPPYNRISEVIGMANVVKVSWAVVPARKNVPIVLGGTPSFFGVNETDILEKNIEVPNLVAPFVPLTDAWSTSFSGQAGYYGFYPNDTSPLLFSSGRSNQVALYFGGGNGSAVFSVNGGTAKLREGSQPAGQTAWTLTVSAGGKQATLTKGTDDADSVVFVLLELAEKRRGTPITTVDFHGEASIPIQLILASQPGALPIHRPGLKTAIIIREKPAKLVTSQRLPPDEVKSEVKYRPPRQRIPRQQQTGLTKGDKIAVGVSVSVVLVTILAVLLFFLIKKPAP